MNDEVLDRNVLVYAYDTSNPEKHEKARQILQHIWGSGGGVTTIQNLCEFFVVVTKKVEKPISTPEASVIVNDIIYSSQWRIYDRDHYTLIKAIELSSGPNVHFWDALIAQTMIDNGISVIVTENITDFEKIPGIKARNPFV
jgi:predicted nucleic acid-binding protein